MDPAAITCSGDHSVVDLTGGELASVLHDALHEGDLLLRQAEQDAAQVRKGAEDDARRMRSDAAARAAECIARAGTAADHLAESARGRAVQIIEAADRGRAEAEREAGEIRRTAEQEAERAAEVLAEAERRAAERRQVAEDDAVALLREAWTAGTTLQEDLLEEAEAEVAAMLQRAEEDAARLRHQAQQVCEEAQELRLHAERIRADARRYADDLATAALAAAPERTAPVPAARSLVRRLLPVVLVLAAVLIARDQVVEPHLIAGASMEPALADGERLLVNKVVYDLHAPRRGDVVVISGRDRSPDDRLVKRVVGVPGDELYLDGPSVRVGAAEGSNEREALERRAYAGSVRSSVVVVTEGHVFVLGDNRAASVDSRHFGLVPISDVIGRVDAVVWPLSEARSV